MKRDLEVVKNRPEAGSNAALRGRFARHFQGYELGLLTVGMVLTFAWLTLPRASEPDLLPLPRIDRSEARRAALGERELSARTETEGLPFELRALGEAIRHFGRAVASGFDANHERSDIRERLASVLDKGQAPLLLNLRAVQTQFFLSALSDFERDGKPNPELEELSADFALHARQNGWFDRAGRCVADEATLRVLFHLHWADSIGKRTVFPFAPSLNEWRIYYHFLLRYPERGLALAEGGAAESARLRVVSALVRKDPDYPGDFAKGYLLYRMGDLEAAAVAFRAQLGRHESGRYSLLARNHLIYTLRYVGSE